MRLSILLNLLVMHHLVTAQSILIEPKSNDTLNYTQIMFEFKQIDNADFYHVEFAKTENFADNNIILKKKTHSLAIMVDSLLDFGNTYFWRVKAFNEKGKITYTSNTSSFYILKSKWSNSNLIKQETILNDSTKSFKSLIIYDYGVIANKYGKIKWFLPQSDGTFRNINLNKDGNITYNEIKGSFEVDLLGKKIWSAPFMLKDSIILKNYHHDLKKLKNGNFLCLAEIIVNYQTDKIYSAIFELDKKNNLKWIWNEEPIYKKRMDGLLSSHINAVDFDEERKVIYISNRNSNSISKIKVADSCYIIKNIGTLNNPVFAGQHSVSIMPNKNLLLFNNNSNEGKGSRNNSSIIEINQPNSNDSIIKIDWEYHFKFKNDEENKCAKAGDADLLPNGNILISSGANNRVFEINRQKEIVWECLSFRRDNLKDIWTPQSSYRVHFCSSLYPNYFTLQYKKTKNLLLGKEQKLGFYINNDGSEDDEYEVSVTADDKIFTTYKINVKAQNRKLQEVIIIPDKPVTVSVNVVSLNNLDKHKCLFYEVK